MTPQDRIRELEEFERRQRQRKQAAARVSSFALLAAAVILACMIGLAWWQLRALRADTDLERKRQADLRAENAQLERRNAILKNQNDLSARWIRERDPVLDPAAPASSVAGPAAGAQPLPDRIYIQILDNADHEFADKMRDKLAAAGFLVVGIEWVKGPIRLNATEVRYYKQADASAAAKIGGILKSGGIPFVRSLYLRRFENSTTVRAHHFEVWFPVRPTQQPVPPGALLP